MKVGINQRFECFDTIRMYERTVVHGIQKDTTNKDRLVRKLERKRRKAGRR